MRKLHTASDYSAAALSRALNQVSSTHHVLLLIDQFEEVFTECKDLDKRNAFFACLMGVIQSATVRFPSPELIEGYGKQTVADNPLHVILTLRADFLGKCLEQDYCGLAQQIQNSDIKLTPLNAEDLRAVIRQPLSRTDKQIAPALLDQLVDESLHEKGSLPLLQHALDRLWNAAEEQQSKQLDLPLYQSLSGANHTQSGLRGLLNQKINAFYDSLSEAQKPLMQWLFLELVQLGEGIEDTRKTLLESELLERQPEHTAAIQDLLKHLIRHERLLTGDADSKQQATVTIAHEALIRDWQLLRQWLDQYRDLKRWRGRIEGDLRDWLATGKNEYLLRGGRLDEAVEKLAEYGEALLIGKGERALVAESLKLKEHNKRNQKRAFISTVVAVIGFLIVATSLWINSEQNLATSIRNQSLMLSGLAKIEINKGHPATAMRLALEALPGSSESYPNRPFVPAAYRALANALAHQYQGIFEHDKSVQDVLISPDGKLLVTKTVNQIYSWDIKTRHFISLLELGKWYESSFTSPSFSPDSSYIAVPTRQGKVYVWNAKTGQFISPLEHGSSVVSARFNSNGTRLATASWDHHAYIWNTQTHELIWVLKGHQDDVNTARFSADNARLITASDDQTAKIWDATTGQLLHTLEGHSARVTSARFSPDDSLVSTASDDTTARLWDGKTGALLFTLSGHSEAVVSARFNRDSSKLLTAGDKTARIWDTHTGTLLVVLQGHADTVNAAHFSPDGHYVVTASNDGTLHVWEAQTGRILPTAQTHTGIVNTAKFSPDGKYLVSASQDGLARLWRHPTGQPLASLQGHQNTVWSAAFSPDGSRIVTASYDNTARLWDAEQGQALATLQGHQREVNSAAFSPDGSRIVTASGDNTARLWDAHTGELLLSLGRSSVLPSANNTQAFWHTFKTIEDVVAYAKQMLPPRNEDIPNFRLTCEERKRFLLDEIERCK